MLENKNINREIKTSKIIFYSTITNINSIFIPPSNEISLQTEILPWEFVF